MPVLVIRKRIHELKHLLVGLNKERCAEDIQSKNVNFMNDSGIFFKKTVMFTGRLNIP